jgi:predicted AAA+ superfamily ATPase
MTTFHRILNLAELLEKRSHFLFGPRATGKSFLIKKQLSETAIVLNLLRTDLAMRLTAEPYLLEGLILSQMQEKPTPYVVIDEIQKVPLLLDEVHRLIEEHKWKFLLTGSSARKLKQGHANLLAGRVRRADLFPLCYPEFPKFNLNRYLRFGGMPIIATSDDPLEDLQSYVNTYLYEEIQAEGFIRNLPAFTRFLQLAAQTSSQILNYTKIASDIGVSIPTIREYYQILNDTLLGFSLPTWTKSKKRKAASTHKFYLFDLGVMHYLKQVESLDRASDLYGCAFEHWIALELRAYLSYRRIKQPLAFWRSQQHLEVDFLVGNTYAFEVKATKRIGKEDLKGLTALAEEKVFKKYYLISHDPLSRISNNIICLSWQDFIEALWADKIIN